MPLNAKKRNWKKSKTTACKNGFFVKFETLHTAII